MLLIPKVWIQEKFNLTKVISIFGDRVSFVSGPIPLPEITTLTGIKVTFALSAPAPGSHVIKVVSEKLIQDLKIAIEGDQNKRTETDFSR